MVNDTPKLGADDAFLDKLVRSRGLAMAQRKPNCAGARATRGGRAGMVLGERRRTNVVVGRPRKRLEVK